MRSATPDERARFHVLLTEDRPYGPEGWTQQLPRLLEPMGVRAFVAQEGRQALKLAEEHAIHAAVLDLATPYATDPDARPGRDGDASMWLLELFRRLPNRPPVVVLRRPAVSRRQAQRSLAEALRLGAFSVLDKPIDIEQLLAVFRRLVDRRYQGIWPDRT